MATICIVGLNYAPEPIGIGPYTQGWAEALVEKGHDVSVICGVPYYPGWALFDDYQQELSDNIENGVRVLRVPHYVPENPSGARRIRHYLSFARQAARASKTLSNGGRLDAVIAIAPALLSAPIASRMARKTDAVSWLHIQDFEVEAAVATGFLPDWLAGFGGRLEHTILRRFDHVSSIAPRMVDKARAKRERGPVHELRNWAEPAVGEPSADGAAMRAKLGLPDGKIALYSGNLARKQGIDLILTVARDMVDRPDLQFVICGAGPMADTVNKAADDLSNLHVRPLQPREDLPHLLAMADVHLLPQLADAADLMLPSKLANMLASGRPVVATAAPGTSLAEEVKGCGVVVAPGNVSAFSNALVALLDDPARSASLGEAARERAQQRWAKTALTERFALALEQAIADKAP